MKPAPIVFSSVILAAAGIGAWQWQGAGDGTSPLYTGSVRTEQAAVQPGNRLNVTPLQPTARLAPKTSGTPVEMAQAKPLSLIPSKPAEKAQEEAAPAVTETAQASPAAQTPAQTQAQAQTPAQAQTQAPAQPTANPSPATVPPVDESALRYFASKGDTVRLQAEIARLRALYPNWVPPENPMAVPQNVDLQLENMWRLYGLSRYAEVRKAIAERQVREPGWQVPENLTAMLAVGEARQRIVNASDLKQYGTVIEVAATNPGLLNCSEVDVMWRVAEAFARSDRQMRARDAYGYILANCTPEPERLATVQKAAALLPRAMVEQLLTQEKTSSTGKGEFEPVKDDLARQFVADAGKDATITVPAAYLTRLETIAEGSERPADALLLGWYYERRNAMKDAETWFRKARAAEDSALASQGLALTLIDRKAPKEAEEVMYRWRTESDDASATYFAAAANLLAFDPPMVLEAEILQRIGKAATDAKNADVAQQFGWYARAFQQPDMALQWFSTALTWKPDDEPSAYGLAITAKQLKMLPEVARIQSAWAGRSPRIANLGEPAGKTTQVIPAPDGTATSMANAYAETAAPSRPAARAIARSVDNAAPRAVAGASRSADASRAGSCNPGDTRSVTAATALPRAWCLMEVNRPAEAAKMFDIALQSSDGKTRSEATYGLSLAYLRLGLTEKASVSATKSRLDTAKATELQVAILTNRAIDALQAKRHSETLLLLDRRAQLSPERTDLMVVRGYAYLGLNRYSQAIRIFESVAATGNRDGIRGLADARAAQAGGLASFSR